VRRPIRIGAANEDAAAVRILVLWSAGRGVAPGEDAGWARSQAQRVSACHGVAAMALHPVTSAAVRHPKPCSWCLELRLAPGHEPSDVVRAAPFAEFLGDMRLMGMRPSVLAIEEELR
jgi:hypothetical protein